MGVDPFSVKVTLAPAADRSHPIPEHIGFSPRIRASGLDRRSINGSSDGRFLQKARLRTSPGSFPTEQSGNGAKLCGAGLLRRLRIPQRRV
jgi:hypothetical protein